MQSDSSSCKVDLSGGDATTSRQSNDAWVKGLENLESMFTDENNFRDENKDENPPKDLNSPAFPSTSDLVRGCLSPSNLFNDCTNRSTDNSNDKPSDRSAKLERSSEKPDDDKPTPEKSSGKKSQKPVKSNKSFGNLSPFESEEPQDADDESEEMETTEKCGESDEDKEMAGPSQEKAEDEEVNDEELNDEEANDEEANDEEDDEEENSEEEDEEEQREKKKKSKKRKAFNERKNIKKLIKEEDLDESILNARKQEEERINRILEHLKSEQGQQLAVRAVDRPSTVDIVLSSDEDDVQIIELSEGEKSDEGDIIKVYEKIPDELDSANSGLHTDDSLNRLNKDGRCLVNVGHSSDEPDVYLDDYLSRKVKPHQIGGIRFMYDCIIESIAKVKSSDGIGGCILAHSMGLGKTLQVIAFTELFLRVTDFEHVLCIVPVNTIQNWMAEYDQWLPNEQGLERLKRSAANGSNGSNGSNEPSTSSAPDVPSTSNGPDPADSKPKPDEYLELRKPRTFTVYSLSDLKSFTQRSSEVAKWRKSGGILLVGYELYRMLFSEEDKKRKEAKSKKPINFAGLTEEDYMKMIEEIRSSLVNPGPDLVICDEGHRIKNCNASISKALKEIKTKRRIILTGYPLQNNLIEYWTMVDFVRPYFLGSKQEFSNMFERPIQNGQCRDSSAFDRTLAKKRAHVLHKLLIGFVQRRSFKILFNTLPRKQEYCFYIRMTDLQKNLMLAFFRNLQNLNSIRPFANSPLYIYSVCHKIWNHTDVLHKKMFEDDSDDEDEELGGTPKKRLKSLYAAESEDVELNYDWANRLMEDYTTGIVENSYKMVVLFRIIDETILLGERLLVFSQSLCTLDVIEEFLNQREVPNKKKKFKKGVNYLRLDGSTSALERKNYIDTFNQNPAFHLFLISTKAGSLGINLTGANRLVVLDCSFNPCHDSQAVHRIFRYGQTRECFVYRFVFDNSLEMKIFDRQINKQSVSNQVVDAINTNANLTSVQINSMVEGLENIEEPPIPRFSEDELNAYSDPIMRIICDELNFCLTKKPLPHESLLAESEETKLTRYEKQLAEAEYNRAVRDSKKQYATNSRNPNDAAYPNPYPNPAPAAGQPGAAYQPNPVFAAPPYPGAAFPGTYPMNAPAPPMNNARPSNDAAAFDAAFNPLHPNNQIPQPMFVPQNAPTQPAASSMYPSFPGQPPSYVPNLPGSSYSNGYANGYAYGDGYGNLPSTSSAVGGFGALDPVASSSALVPSYLSSLPQPPSAAPLYNVGQWSGASGSASGGAASSYPTSSHSSTSHYEQFTRRERMSPLQKNFIVPQDLKIKDDLGTEIQLKKGQMVLLIQSENSLILRTFSGKQVHIKGAFANFFSASNQANMNIRHQTVASDSNQPAEEVVLSDED